VLSVFRVLDSIQFILFGRGLYLAGIDSQVFLHIIIQFSFAKSLVDSVIFLKYFISSEIFQAKLLFFQIQFFESAARIIEKFIINFIKELHSHWSSNYLVRFII
jgi:hypothetical protein